MMTTSEPDRDLDALVEDWLTFPDVAELLGVQVTKVHRLVEDSSLVAVKRGEREIRSIPSRFFVDDDIAPHLAGTITLLKDQGFSDPEIIEWLFTEDDSLPGAPIDHLRAGQRGEVRRRAQAIGF